MTRCIAALCGAVRFGRCRGYRLGTNIRLQGGSSYMVINRAVPTGSTERDESRRLLGPWTRPLTVYFYQKKYIYARNSL